MMNRTVVLFCVLSLSVAWSASSAPESRAAGPSQRPAEIWSLLPDTTDLAARQDRSGWRIRPEAFQLFSADTTRLRQLLDEAPAEQSAAALRTGGAGFTVPLPDGSIGRFRIVESPIMEPALAAKFPDIRTFTAQGIDDPSASGRIDLTPDGFHGFIMSAAGPVFVDPAGEGLYMAYRAEDYSETRDFVCQVPSPSAPRAERPDTAERVASGATLRTYRLALGCTGEYSVTVASPNAPSVQRSLSAIVTTMNRVVGIYEREVSVRMVLVANNDQILFLDGETDPYNNNSAGQMLDQNQTTLDQRIGSGNYDVGHVFSTRGGGLAFVGAVCESGAKAGGVTGITTPFGDPFDVDYVAHEMGHQFGANHPFNGTSGACSGSNRNADTAYEVGSGSTIMAYAGICGSQNLQLNSDPYFHGINYDEIVDYTSIGQGSFCAQTSATGNRPPAVDAGPEYTIPANTPFALTAVSSSDPDGDALTYCWEQFDRGPANDGLEDNKQSPLFRSFLPSASPTRMFPRLGNVLANTQTYGEILPQSNRTMSFRVTARDNRAGGGGVNFDMTSVKVAAKAGPFRVASFNAGGTLTVDGGSSVTIQWDVAKTNKKPVKAKNVRILLSTDGGQTFSTVLVESTKNDGSETIVIPDVATTKARIKIEGAGNIFFDINDLDFTIN